MAAFNIAYDRVLGASGLTLGLMTPAARKPEAMADLDTEVAIARRADALGFGALWTLDVPLMVPQGSHFESAPLDDPFLWLGLLAGATKTIAVGTAAAVLPLRHPLHLAKSALSLDRLSGGRFILGLGSGDRDAEFVAFGVDVAKRGEAFRDGWSLVRAALSPDAHERQAVLEHSGGFDVSLPPARRVPMLVVGSARQSLQWIASSADGWATYHRDEVRQQGRIGLWQTALRERASGQAKPFIQSLHLDLLGDPAAPAEPIELGLRTGRHALVAYLRRMHAQGVAHVLLHLAANTRTALDVVDELGTEVLPVLAGTSL